MRALSSHSECIVRCIEATPSANDASPLICSRPFEEEDGTMWIICGQSSWKLNLWTLNNYTYALRLLNCAVMQYILGIERISDIKFESKRECELGMQLTFGKLKRGPCMIEPHFISIFGATQPITEWQVPLMPSMLERQRNTDALEYGLGMWLQIIGYRLIYFDGINNTDELRAMAYDRLSLSNYTIIDSAYYRTCIDYHYSPFTLLCEIGQYVYHRMFTPPPISVPMIPQRRYDIFGDPQRQGHFRHFGSSFPMRYYGTNAYSPWITNDEKAAFMYWERKMREQHRREMQRAARKRRAKLRRNRKYAMIKCRRAKKAAKAAHTKYVTQSKQSSHSRNKDKTAWKAFSRKR